MTAPRSSEAHWQQQVEQIAKTYNWRCYHAPDNRPSGRTGRVQRVTAGFPDLVIVRDGELLFAELKTETGRIRPEQQQWLADLAAVPGIETYIWRPSDFDEMVARLSRGRVRLADPDWRPQAA